jgi:transposase
MKGVFIMPHKTKATGEEKVMLVKKYLAGEKSAADICQTVGIAKRSFRDWVRIYQQEGSLGLISSGTNRRYSRELKINAVKAYLAGEGSHSEICAKYKIKSRRQLRDWIKLYNSGETPKEQTGGSRMDGSRKTTLEERIKIAKACIESGYNYGETAQKFNVGYQQVYTWVKKFTAEGEAGLEDRRGRRKKNQEPRSPEEEAQIKIAKLEHENYMLRMERDLLKKLEELERRDAFRK